MNEIEFKLLERDKMHAIQTGIAYELEVKKDVNDAYKEHMNAVKHLRVGLTGALCAIGALWETLEHEGVVTADYRYKIILKYLDAEVRSLEQSLTEIIGVNVVLY